MKISFAEKHTVLVAVSTSPRRVKPTWLAETVFSIPTLLMEAVRATLAEPASVAIKQNQVDFWKFYSSV